MLETYNFSYEEIDGALKNIGLCLNERMTRRNEEWEYFIGVDNHRVNIEQPSLLLKNGHCSIGAISILTPDDALIKLVKAFTKNDLVLREKGSGNQWDHAYKFDLKKCHFVERELTKQEKEVNLY